MMAGGKEVGKIFVVSLFRTRRNGTANGKEHVKLKRRRLCSLFDGRCMKEFAAEQENII